jgi:hypothetical protein
VGGEIPREERNAVFGVGIWECVDLCGSGESCPMDSEGFGYRSAASGFVG